MVFTCFYALVRGCCWSTLSKMTQTLPGGSPKWGFGRSSTIAILPPPSSQPHELPLYITAMKNPPQKTTKTIQQTTPHLPTTSPIFHIPTVPRRGQAGGSLPRALPRTGGAPGHEGGRTLDPKMVRLRHAMNDGLLTFFFFCQETVGDISP